ncbi:hypothetical protein DL96DRAFT_474950 [Flagelloscypha sp. PMI_526]|nr:hypothetical protein DL96DRAFT_474950 [Flagelloscypha sp. PMI_526]
MAIMPRTLSNLPVEILHLVFELLPTRSLLLSQLICKHFRRIIRESSHLQYTLSLSKSRLVESPLADLLGLSYSDLLAIHRQHEKAWRTFDFSCRHDLHLPRGNVYDLKSSLYAHGIESDNGTTSSVTFYDLPHAPYARGSQNNTTTEHVTDTPPRLRSWTHPITDLTLRDFTVDPSQDLLVFVAVTPQSPACYEVHFRTLSGNVAHPLAMSPSIPCLPRAFANPFGPVMGGPALPGMANVGQALQNVFQAMHPLQGLLNTVNQLLAAAGGQVLPVPGGPPAPPPAAPPPGIPALPQGPLAMPQPVQPNPSATASTTLPCTTA